MVTICLVNCVRNKFTGRVIFLISDQKSLLLLIFLLVIFSELLFSVSYMTELRNDICV